MDGQGNRRPNGKGSTRIEPERLLTWVPVGEEGPYGSSEGDLVYDDGTIHAVCSITNDPSWEAPRDALVIHGFGYNHAGEKGGGHARRALSRIREHFPFVIADNCIPTSLGFWRKMGEEGLIDVMNVVGGPHGGMTRFHGDHEERPCPSGPMVP